MTWWMVACALCVACGESVPAVSSPPSLEKALVSPSGMLEYELSSTRQALWEELLAQAQEQATHPSHAQPLFPIFMSTGFVAKEGPAELLHCFEAEALELVLKWDERRESWSDIPREDWRGLSERELARCLALSLLTQWQIKGEVSLQKVPRSPYAAAYVEGSLRLNPAFVSLAAAALESALASP
jgi:hypothetical protein